MVSASRLRGGCAVHATLIDVYPSNSDWDDIAKLISATPVRTPRTCGNTLSGLSSAAMCTSCRVVETHHAIWIQRLAADQFPIPP